MTTVSRAVSSSSGAIEGKTAIGDIEIAFTQSGNGTPVLFVHGLAEDRHSWEGVIARLRQGHRCHAVDLRGHGGTSIGRPEGTPAQLSQDLIGYLEAVTGPAICVGFSLGGVLVLEAALQRPDLVNKAVVIGTSSKVGRAAADFFASRIQLLERDPGRFRQELRRDTEAQIVVAKDRIDEIARKRVEAVGDGAGYINAARAMIALASAPMTERLTAISVPVHIIHGSEDIFCPIKAADMLRTAMPAAADSEIPRAGHLMSVDQAEALAAAIEGAIGRAP